ncbi:MAG: bifunctional UDP-sugar hydrolase/5'-nucleotidase [Rhodothermales bacterium]
MQRIILFSLLSLTQWACTSTQETVLPVPFDEPVPASAFEFVVVQLNDVYEISPLDAGRVGGLARVATVINQLKEKNPNTIAVLSGDFLSPSLISSLSEEVDGKKQRIAGAQIIAAFNAMGLDYVTFGNHEFDIKAPDLQRRLDESEFVYLSSNVMQKTEGQPPRPFMQHGKAIPNIATHIFKTDSGADVKLGLIGVTLPFNQAAYVHYEEVNAAGLAAFNQAKEDHDIVFAITHLSMEGDEQFARAIPDLPFIIGGHEHSDSLTTVGNTRIAKADANARTIYIHWIQYDLENKDISIWSQLMPITSDIKEDPHTAEVVASWEKKAEALIGNMGYDANAVITTLPVALDGRESIIRNYQTNLGRLITCAMLDIDETADFAFINSGSIRIDDKLNGQIQERDVLRTLPFGGPVIHGRFKGDVLQRVLEAGLVANKDAGGYFQITGNVVNIDGSYRLNGTAIDPEAMYEVVLPEFLSLGLEENLDFMDEEGEYNEIKAADVNLDIRNLVIRYLKRTDWENDCSFSGIKQF